MIRTLSILLAITASSAAQLTSTVGPPVAPVGCPIAISISNDTNTTTGNGSPRTDRPKPPDDS